MSKVLLTGGLGYIGSHVAVELVANGYEPVILDDLSNSELFVLDRLKELTDQDIPFEQGDIRDLPFLNTVFGKYDVSNVIHFAAKKAVGESVQLPLLYFDVNVNGLINLLKLVERSSIQNFIFSSSCTVYGIPEKLPVTESTPFGDTPSPYGKTKQMCEEILKAVSRNVEFQTVALRYFNPVGAHDSALIGELPKGVPNNLLPFITQTAAGLRDKLSVFGGDYDTPDGTAVRDYIHVVDLARAHVKALEVGASEYLALNVGTGQGHSVLEVVNAFMDVTEEKLPYQIMGRREGDVPMIYGETSLSNEVLGWKADHSLQDMVRDAWNWQKNLMG